jgi:hypothetical protein
MAGEVWSASQSTVPVVRTVIGQLVRSQSEEAGLHLLMGSGGRLGRFPPSAPRQGHWEDHEQQSEYVPFHGSTRVPTAKFSCSTPTM